RLGQVDAVHARRVAQIRGRTKQQAVDDGEHRRVGADAERQGEHDAGAERRFGANAARRVADVVRQAVDEGGAAAVADFFFRSFEAAERDQRVAAGVLEGDAALHVLFRFTRDVEAELRVELAFDVAAPDQGAGAVAQVAPEFAQHRASPGNLSRWFPLFASTGRENRIG